MNLDEPRDGTTDVEEFDPLAIAASPVISLSLHVSEVRVLPIDPPDITPDVCRYCLRPDTPAGVTPAGWCDATDKAHQRARALAYAGSLDPQLGWS